MSDSRRSESRRSIRVLLVEDNPGDADLVRERLESAGPESFSVVWIETLAEALAQLSQDQFDVILLDLSLTDSQGLETFRSIHDQAPQMPIDRPG
jgi:CheY-like chemotaxis protein